jgi:hypothetical protein
MIPHDERCQFIDFESRGTVGLRSTLHGHLLMGADDFGLARVQAFEAWHHAPRVLSGTATTARNVLSVKALKLGA